MSAIAVVIVVGLVIRFVVAYRQRLARERYVEMRAGLCGLRRFDGESVEDLRTRIHQRNSLVQRAYGRRAA